mgnify:CR=1 FL=1
MKASFQVMNSICQLLLTLLSLALFTACSAPEDSLKHLGQTPFDKNAWAQANQEGRGAMAYDLIKKVQSEKLNSEQIKDLLGQPTGYFDYDETPAYFVGPQTVTSQYGKGYLIAFPFDPQTAYPLTPVVIP